MHLLYLTFGENINNHIQGHFSIFSFLTQQTEISSINIITDTPAMYKDIADRINIIPINEQKLNEWKGEHDFFWRVKIKAIEMICDLHKNEPVIYLDTDTFLYRNLNSLKQDLVNGTALMHEDEGSLSHLKGKTLEKMWQQVNNKIFGATKINNSHKMWNAGVVATPNTKNNSENLLALSICDEMCKAGVTPRLIEQFALSVALQETYGLNAAEKTIAHYWSTKDEWSKVISAFFISCQFKGLTIDQMIEQIREFDFSQVAVRLKLKNTNVRLKTFVEKIFPPKDVEFVNNQLQQET